MDGVNPKQEGSGIEEDRYRWQSRALSTMDGVNPKQEGSGIEEDTGDKARNWENCKQCLVGHNGPQSTWGMGKYRANESQLLHVGRKMSRKISG